MRTIRLTSIDLQNFKGVRSLHMQIDGQNCTIIGDNGTGKTTIYDAYLWCLFGVTSSPSVQIQPLDKDNNIIHKIETKVELVLNIDGTYEVKVARTLREVWKINKEGEEKQRPSEIQRYYNDVPLSMKDFNEKLQELADVEKWKMLSNISQLFNMKTDDRRNILIGLSEKIDEEKLMVEFPALLKARQEHKTLEELQRQNKITRKESEAELKGIPKAINAIGKLWNDEDFSLLEQQKQELETKIHDIDLQLRASDEEQLADHIYKTKLAGLEEQVEKERKQWKAQHAEQVNSLEAKKNLLLAKKRDAQYIADTHKDENNKRERRLSLLETELNNAKAKWNEYDKQEFSQNEVCPMCGRLYTEEQKEEARVKFNSAKAKKLQEFRNEILKTQERWATIRGKINEYYEITLKADNRSLSAIEESVKEVTTDLEDISFETENQYEPYIEAQRQLTQQREMKPQRQENVSLVEERKMLQEKRDEVLSKLAGKSMNEKLKKERAKLETRTKELAEIISECDNALYQIATYKRKKIALIEESVNRHFDFVSWKFYEKNITNDEERECCECVADGVDYNSMNFSKRINANVDISKGLSRAYGIETPIFVDNRESSVKLLPTSNQQISLKVKENSALQPIIY